MSKRPRIARSPSPGQSPENWSRSPSPASPAPSCERSKILLQDTGEPAVEVMHCSLPPHREVISFSSYEDYEVHYLQTHVNRCSECGKNFPTDRFLNLHIEENHDPLVAAKRDKGEKTYSCFIEDCDRKCSTPQKRRMHLIDKHMFPKTTHIGYRALTAGRQAEKPKDIRIALACGLTCSVQTKRGTYKSGGNGNHSTREVHVRVTICPGKC
ncbi:uncharacterized protein P174DRAFT_365104 [Aspergillus novofumigatus IBT 16806]|uniref:C2H2-type domain-containing protein n=1 Tax=Aspergillus novofumigatus (strain IBT 16806) TaxID=1392255 RepID=A0A2I1CGU8_ASPN1|nr:uncharacterized protein P174DRAFT_365104 [Aspergillus novofumigatus IBT 16806]PKX96834.1 hypothetical protein P174DRAFT_365104 [Aspergillus novofumigatus IBT 16806]